MAILPFIAQNMNIDTTHIPSYPLFLSVHIFQQPHPDVSKYTHKYPYFRNNASEQQRLDKIIVAVPHVLPRVLVIISAESEGPPAPVSSEWRHNRSQ